MKVILISILFFPLVFITGCSKYTWEGLPKEHYKVGGGFSIDYVAPEEGYLYYADRNSNKIMILKVMAKGQNFLADSSETLELFEKAELYINDVKPVLYFIPAEKK